VVDDLLSEVSRLDERIAHFDQHIRSMARQSTAAQRLMQLSGVGETTATAIAAKNARMCWAVLKHGEGFKMPA
jgi:transposase